MIASPKERRNMAWARRVIWERLATTAIGDLDTGWHVAEFDDESTQLRLEKASKQVARSIRRQLKRKTTR